MERPDRALWEPERMGRGVSDGVEGTFNQSVRGQLGGVAGRGPPSRSSAVQGGRRAGGDRPLTVDEVAGREPAPPLARRGVGAVGRRGRIVPCP